MGKFLFAAIVAVVVSALLSVLLLVGLFGLIPLPLPNLGDAVDPERQATIISAIAGLSTAISTILALVVGAIAILVLIRLSGAESTSVEQLKRDLLSIQSALLSIRNRSLLYTNPELVNVELDPFEHEREALAKLLLSPTGLALYVWAESDGKQKYPDLFIDIGSLINFLTLDLRQYFGAVAVEITERSNAMVIALATIDASDRTRMAGYLSNIDVSLHTASDLASKDTIGQFVRRLRAATDDDIAAPTEAELDSLKQEAERKIGGESAETIEHFGRAAIDGSADDRRTFQRLVKQLGLGSDETARTAEGMGASPEPYRPPTEAELDWLKGEADRKVGGKAAEMVEIFGRAAIDGYADDRRKFHSLIEQLLQLKLDDMPQ